MENKKENKDVCNEFLKRIKDSLHVKIPQEVYSNPMMVGRVANKSNINYLIQPHNYRLYFDFDRSHLKIPNPTQLKKKVGIVGFEYGKKNYESEHHFNNFYACRIVIKKTQVEVTNKSYDKQWRLISTETLKENDEIIDEIIENLDNQCIEVLKKLMKIIGGKSNFKLLKKRGELGIHGDDYLDKIPEDMIIHDTVFKKVYKRKVEFYKPAHVKNYITNRAIENIAPEIAQELAVAREMIKGTLEVNVSTSKTLNHFVTMFLPIQQDFAINIKSHTKVIKDMTKGFNKFNRLLSERQKKLGDFL